VCIQPLSAPECPSFFLSDPGTQPFRPQNPDIGALLLDNLGSGKEHDAADPVLAAYAAYDPVAESRGVPIDLRDRIRIQREAVTGQSVAVVDHRGRRFVATAAVLCLDREYSGGPDKDMV